MDVEKELVRVRRVVRLQGVVMLSVAAWFVGSIACNALERPLSEVKVRREGNAVSISSMSDGPYIVTHLAVRGQDAGSESDKCTAALPEPTAFIDSNGLYIEDITRLDWRDITGKPVSAPYSSTPITALMIEARYLERK